MTTGQLSEYKAWSSLCIKYERNMFIRCPILILQTLFSLGLCQFVCKHTYKVLGSRDSLKVWSMATEARIMSLNPGMHLRILLTFMCQITFVYHGIKDKRKHLEVRTNFSKQFNDVFSCQTALGSRGNCGPSHFERTPLPSSRMSKAAMITHFRIWQDSWNQEQERRLINYR